MKKKKKKKKMKKKKTYGKRTGDFALEYRHLCAFNHHPAGVVADQSNNRSL